MATVYQLVDVASGALRSRPVSDPAALRDPAAGEVVWSGDRPTGADLWDAAARAWRLSEGAQALAAAASAASAVPHLTVAQFRDRWTWAEQVRFELLAAADTTAGAELRAIRATLEDRRVAGVGVDPTSAKTAAMLARCVALGALDADRVADVAATVGTHLGEDGYPPPAVPPA